MFLRYLGLNQYIQGDEGAVASGLVAVVAVAYALYAGFIFVNVWSQWTTIEEAVKTYKVATDEVTKDQAHQKFILNKDKRIPKTAKILLFVFSLFLVVAVYLLYFQNSIPGGYAIFTVIMIVSTYWTVIMDLDDPFSGIWNVQVPEEWRQ